MKFTTLLAVAAGVAASPIDVAAPRDAAADQPTFYLIRHAEKNSDGTISSKGMKREQCLVKRFGRDSEYNIQHIMVQTPHAGDPRSQRPYNTTLPLANSLGIKIDTPCDYKDPKCAAKHAHQYTGGNVLIAWEHIYLPQVAQAIGAKDAPKNPSSHFDWIYTVAPPYTKATLSSEDCPGLD